ncbi:hypothetical protein K5L52_000608 [Listeria monocytogenes]|nr:hypothetical protein [Listeria monocytogenes]EAC7891751.1 hypothetical protein [Listeria monocytogenes]EAC8616654.1 hypothetical protein [Listeria monocytogenes]EAC9739621.1 hypothetical protein [Listeria monocytogenes]EAC9745924.1 hypothetical protein [Listeria monocytogenes]
MTQRDSELLEEVSKDNIKRFYDRKLKKQLTKAAARGENSFIVYNYPSYRLLEDLLLEKGFEVEKCTGYPVHMQVSW